MRKSLLPGLFFLAVALAIAKFVWPLYINAQGAPTTPTTPARSGTVSADADVNIRNRGWVKANFSGGLLDHPNQEDPKAPQLSTLMGGENHNPTFNTFGQVNARGGSGPDPSNASNPGIATLQASGAVFSPKQGYEIGGGYSYVVLYIGPSPSGGSDIVIHDTLADSVASGYTLHLFNINVNPTLKKMYDDNEAAGRKHLLAIPCHYQLGTTTGSSDSSLGSGLLFSIRDTGSFMDPRYKDWWTEPVIENCKDIPPGLVDQSLSAKNPYFEYNIQRADTTTVLKNFADEYSVACMPAINYKVNQGNITKCLEPGNSCPQGYLQWNNLGANLSVTSTNTLFGLFRDEQAATGRYESDTASTNRFESLESYLDVKSPEQMSATTTTSGTQGSANAPAAKDQSVNDAPIYKLTSQGDQCRFVQQKLAAVVELCKPTNQIEGVDTTSKRCALDAKIPTTVNPNETNLSLAPKVLGIQDCDKFMTDPTSDQNLKQEILDTPLALENAYRPAFVVAVTKFDGDGIVNDPATSVSVSTEQHPAQSGRYFTVVDYMEVKVPAFGSDFINPASQRANPDKNNTARDSYKDPLRLTADVLTPLTTQQDWQKQLDAHRAQIRSTLQQQTANPTGNHIIGSIGNPVLCYKNGQLADCTSEFNSAADLKAAISGAGGVQLKDTLPNALYRYINAYGTACGGDEKSFYDADNTKRVVEKAQQIGVSLTPLGKMGVFTKKTDGKVHLSVNVKDITKDATIRTQTDFYFVSPHSDTLEYVQRSFYNFLTLRDQQQLSALGLLAAGPTGAQANLDESQFPPSLKAELPGGLKGDQQPRTGFGPSKSVALGTTGAPLTSANAKDSGTLGTDTTTAPVKLAPNTFQYGASVGPVDGLTPGQPQKQSIFWQVAGQVASLPTRLMALVTSPVGSVMSDYTLSCTKDPNDPTKPNFYATEDWLLGKCGGGTEKKGACTANGDTTVDTETTSTGATASISAGDVALALKVSQATCVPAEVIIGIQAKEGRGMFIDGTPLTGKADELSYRNAACATIPEPAYSGIDCSPFSYSLNNMNSEASRYSQLAQSCFSAVGVSPSSGSRAYNGTDNQKLGIAMCHAAAKLWAGMVVGNTNSKMFQAQYVGSSGTYGCTGGAWSMPGGSGGQTVDQEAIDGAISNWTSAGATGHNSLWESYNTFIQKYAPFVAKVRGENVCTP